MSALHQISSSASVPSSIILQTLRIHRQITRNEVDVKIIMRCLDPMKASSRSRWRLERTKILSLNRDPATTSCPCRKHCISVWNFLRRSIDVITSRVLSRLRACKGLKSSWKLLFSLKVLSCHLCKQTDCATTTR